MSTPEPTVTTHRDTRDEGAARCSWAGTIAGIATVAAGAALITAGPGLPSVLAGLNFG